jgi:hypothetical protein
MSDLQPLKRRDAPEGPYLGVELVKRLNQALESGDYHQIQMIASRPRDTLDSDSRSKIALALQSFGDLVGSYVLGTLPAHDELRSKESLSVNEALSYIQAVCEVRHELAKIKALHVIAEHKMVILETRVEATNTEVNATILKFGAGLREQFSRANRDLLGRLTKEMERVPRDITRLKELSAEVTRLFRESCLIEDHVPGWTLGSDRRGYLRIAAKELTYKGGVPTEVPFREDKTAKGKSPQRHRRNF